jgi:HK97 family phage major capsid protein
MNLIDLREQRNRLMHEATAIMQAAEVTAEQRTKATAILADVDALDADIAILERTAAFDAEQRSLPSNRPNPAATEERSALEKRAFADFIRFGTMPEQRDLLTTSASGAAIIPQAYAPEIISAQKAWGGLYNSVKLWKTENGAPMKTSLVNDVTNVMSPVTEGTAPTGTDPSATSILISTDEIQGLVKVSLAELQDASFSVEQFLRDAFGPRYFRGVTNLMVAGSSSGNVGSIVTPYATNQVTTSAVGTLAYADLVAAYGKLDPAYEPNASWVFNSTTRAALMGVVDTLGRPLFIPSPNAGAFDTLLGRPVVISQAHANVATGATAAQFGDLSAGYKLRVVNPGLTVVRLNERYMDALEIGFVAYARVGGAATNAGTPAIVNIAIK